MRKGCEGFPCVEAKPLANIDRVADPDTNSIVIMKAGKIYKERVKDIKP